jgi:hypothetical protein
MWRGGLSGPRSLFIHADLALISENTTSPLLHEVMHIGTGLKAAKGGDWIVEGIAEYYGLEILRRSRTISNERFDQAIVRLRKWGAKVDDLCVAQSTGSTTARAVGIMAALDKELRKSSSGRNGLDNVLRELVASGHAASVTGLRSIADKLNDGKTKTLESDNLPGCD